MEKIYECIVGSHAYGTNVETSDIDIKGVYIEPVDNILGFKYKEQINLDKDTTYYEVRRFLELLSKGNPTLLEMLFVDDQFVKLTSPRFQLIRDCRDMFLTRQCMDAFVGFAKQQIHKARGLNKKINWEKDKTVRKTPLDFCFLQYGAGSIPLTEFLSKEKLKQEYCGLCKIDHMPNCYVIYYDFSKQYALQTNTPGSYVGFGYSGIVFEQSNDLRLSSIPKEQVGQQLGIIYYNKDAYSIHCKEYNEYLNWLANRNVARYVDTVKANFGETQLIDSKNLMHCIRLINCGIEIAKYGRLTVFRSEALELLKIRRGEIPLEKILELAQIGLDQMTECFAHSNIPQQVDQERVHNLLVKIRKHN